MEISHAEELRSKNSAEFEKLERLTNIARVIANHVSLNGEAPLIDLYEDITYHSHMLGNGGGFEYRDNYSTNFSGSIVAVKLTNCLAEQVRLRPVIEARIEGRFAPSFKSGV